MFIVDLRASGAAISPIPTLDGHQLNAVHLDDVEVEADRLVGQPGEAWPIVQRALAEERHLQVLPGRFRRDFEDLVAWSIESESFVTTGTPLATGTDRGGYRHGRGWMRQLVSDAMLRRDSLLLAARQKLIGTELMQRIAASCRRNAGIRDVSSKVRRFGCCGDSASSKRSREEPLR